ncbi:MAG: hypothetical protein Q9219_004012 [cf. Caloplaca sp. 3 TL-2023]
MSNRIFAISPLRRKKRVVFSRLIDEMGSPVDQEGRSDGEHPPEPDGATLPEKKRRPGQPRSPTKSAPSRNHRQPRVESEASEQDPGVQRMTRSQKTTAASDSSDSSLTLSITSKLKDYREFLRNEDPQMRPDFELIYDRIQRFVDDLADSREPFDVRVYNDLKAMLRVQGERMHDQEELEAQRAQGPITYRVPSSSITESSTRTNPDPTRVFSSNVAVESRGSTPGTTNLSEETQRDKGALEDQILLDAQLEEDNPLEFAPSLLREAEENMLRQPIRSSGDRARTSKGKRPLSEVEDPERTDRRIRKGRKKVPAPHVPERATNGQGEDLIENIPRPGSGSLIPPEIADFEADEEDIPIRPITGTTEDDEENDTDTQFWPGDPVFMFGETKFLQAVKSRQIDKDLAPGRSPHDQAS